MMAASRVEKIYTVKTVLEKPMKRSRAASTITINGPINAPPKTPTKWNGKKLIGLDLPFRVLQPKNSPPPVPIARDLVNM